MKTHWLYGFGPNKEIKFNVEIDAESKCETCIHRFVCDRDMSKRCSNYDWGTSDGRFDTCSVCIHRYTRYDKQSIPCFHCKFYEFDVKLKEPTNAGI